MNYFKTLGLAAIAAIALIALMGAGSASATVFCKTKTTPCTEKYPAGTEIHAVLETGTKLTKMNDTRTTMVDTCPQSTFSLKTSNAGSASETVSGAISTLTLTECKFQNTILVKGTLEFHYDEKTGSTIVTGKNSEYTELISGTTCIYGYGAGTTVGVLQQPASSTSDTVLNMEMTINRIAGGFLCQASTWWDAKYTITSPVPLYVTSS